RDPAGYPACFLLARWRSNLLTAGVCSRLPAAILRRSGDTSHSKRRARDADHSFGLEDPPGARSHRYEEGLRQPRRAGAGGAQEGSVLGSFVCFPRQKGGHDENSVLGRQWTVSLHQATAARPLHLALACEPSGTVTLTPAQLAMLIEGIDWRTPERTWKP